jgi:hypothetical protein
VTDPSASGVRWMFPAAAVAPAGADAARELLARSDTTERQLFALVYGYALDLGLAAWTLDLDAALAHWRLRTSLADAREGGSEGLERSVAALLRAQGGPSDEARRIAAELPAAARTRLQAALDGTRVASAGAAARSGLGVGSLVVVVFAIAAFLLYGVIRDSDPRRHGKNLVRLGDYATARIVFEELGTDPEARAWTAIAWLSEGNYQRALETLKDPGAMKYLAMFRPMDEPLEPLEVDPASRVLLPRGLITTPTPWLVYQAGPAGEILLLGRPLDGAADPMLPIRIRVPETGAPPKIIALNWPAEVAPLKPGDYSWTVPGSELHPGTFALLPDEQQHELESNAAERWRNEIPYAALVFLRAHFYLRNRLYMQAGQNFATLAARFPDEVYPREMVAQVAAALGVDPSAFLR